MSQVVRHDHAVPSAAARAEAGGPPGSREDDGLLPAAARELYERLACGGTAEPGTPGLDTLQDLGIALREPLSGLVSVVNPDQAERQLHSRVAEALAHSVRLFSDLSGVIDDLRAGQSGNGTRGTSGTSFFLEGQDATNRSINAASSAVREEVLTAQPGPRTRRRLSLTQDRDASLLARGVSVRTLYHASSRANPAVQERVGVMAPRGGRFRSLPGPFLRMIVFDRNVAYLPDRVQNRPVTAGAWRIEDPAVCAFLADVFEQQWNRADDWFAPAGPGEDCVSTPLQRAILRELCAGHDQQQIAKALGYSARTVNAHLTDLRARLGFRTLYQLIHWWATSPERERE